LSTASEHQPPAGAPSGGASGRHAAEVYNRVEESADFDRLRRSFRSFAFPMTAAFLGWYLLYVIMSGWARGFMGQKLIGNINVALVFGLLQFATTFLITWLYWRHADKNLDPLADRIRHEIEEEGVR